MIAILLLAAGQSSRMRGRHKLFEKIDGQALLARSAGAAAKVPDTEAVVVLPPKNSRHLDVLAGLDVQTVTAHDAETGMSASIRAGIAALSADVTAVIVSLADMPAIKTGHYTDLIAAHLENPGAIIQPVTDEGHRGNPVLFPKQDFSVLAGLSGDRGARGVMREHADRIQQVTMDNAILLDLDTPEDFAIFRSA